MNNIKTWIEIIAIAIVLIGGHMLFIADSRYFSITKASELVKEFVVVVERQRTASEIQKENLKAIKRINARQTDMEKKWLRKEINDLKRKNRKLRSIPRGR